MVLILAAGCLQLNASQDIYDGATLMFNSEEYDLAVEEYGRIVELKGKEDLDGKAAFYLGESYFRLKEYPKAAEAFKDFLKRFKTHALRAKGQYRFAESHYLAGQHKIASAAYGRFIGENPGDPLAPKALYAQAGAYMELGLADKAKESLESLIKDHPDDEKLGEAQYFLAWSHFKEKRFKEAGEAFLAFVKQSPRAPKAVEARLRAADAFYSLEDFQRSLGLYNDVLSTGEGDFKKESRVGIAWSYYKLKDFAKAGNYFTLLASDAEDEASRSEYFYQALRSFYDGEEYAKGYEMGQKRQATGALSGDTEYWMGLFALKLSKEEQALAHFEEATKKELSKIDRATIHLELGNLLNARGDGDRALGVFQKALALDLDTKMESQIRYEASRILHGQGKTEAALEMVADNLDAGGELKGEIVDLSEFSAGEFKYAKGDHRGAMVHYQRVVERSHEDQDLRHDALYRLVWCHRHLGQSEKASQSLLELEKGSDKYRQEARYLLAEIHRENQEFAKAAQWYDKVRQLKGDFGANALLAMAQMHYQSGRTEEVRVALNTLFRDFPGSDLLPESHLLMAEVSFDLKDLGEALKNYDLALESDKANVMESALYGRAWLKFEQGDVKGAIADLDGLLEKYPETPFRQSALQLKGQIYMQSNQLDEARKVFNEGLGEGGAGGTESLLLNLAGVETELGNYEKALEAYNDLLSRFPGSTLQGRVTYEKGWLYMEMARPNEALLMFQAYRKSWPEGSLIEDVDFALGQLAYERKAFTEAAKAYERSSTSDRYRDKALYKWAFAHFRQDQFDLAAEVFGRLVREVPESPLSLEASFREGQSWLKASKFEEAGKALDAYIAKGRGDAFYPQALQDLGVVYEKLDRKEDAINTYENHLKLFPDDASTLQVGFAMARLYIDEKRYADSREHFKRILKDRTHPLALEAQYLEGYAYFMEDRFEDAIRSFLKTQLYKDGDHWQSLALLHIARCHESTGRKDRAKRYIDKVIQQFPGTESSREAMDLLKKIDGA